MPNILICYDTPNNKRRKKIADILEGYGVRVNYSVFEITANHTKVKQLEAALIEVVDAKKDHIRIYTICENCTLKSKVLCSDTLVFLPQSSILI